MDKGDRDDDDDIEEGKNDEDYEADEEEEQNIGDVVKTVAMTGGQWQPSCASNQREVPGGKKEPHYPISLSKISTVKCCLHQVIGLVSWGIGCAR